MKNTIKWVLSLLIFFAAVPTVQASDMSNSAGMEEIKKKKKPLTTMKQPLTSTTSKK